MKKNDNRLLRAATLGMVCVLAVMASPLVAGDDPRPLRILRINPSGEDVPAGRQIVLQFDRAVVPVGRMERTADEIPIKVTPDPNCEWRWINTSSLACQLGEQNALVPSTRYEMQIDPGITAEDGGTLAQTHRHTFITERPKVTSQWFETWTSPGTPHVRVTFDQIVTEDSAARHLHFKLPNGSKVPVTLDRKEGWNETTWIVVPATELPLDEQVALSVEPGIEPAKGNEPGIENRKLVVFPTFPEHRFLGIECRGLAGKQLILDVGALQTADERCDPLGYVQLVFSSPVIKEVLRDHLKFDPDLAGGREDYDPWERMHSYSRLSGPPQKHRYGYPLPEALKAFADYELKADPAALRDEFDRPLERAIDFRFRTDHRKPRLDVNHTASVLESQVETHLPIVVTNLDAVNVSFRRWTTDGVGEQDSRRAVTPEAQDIAYRFPLQVRDWLDGKSGAVVGSASAEPSTGQLPSWFISQVTPYQVHVKLGHYNTLVWVTDLATGDAVEGARVEVVERIYSTLAEVQKDPTTISSGQAISAGPPADDDSEEFREGADDPPRSGVTDERGIAVLAGSETLDPELRRVAYWTNRNQPHLFVLVQKDGELAVVPLEREFMVDQGSSAYPSRLRRHGHLRTWGATAQGIYRAGDTVQYKIYVRNEGNETLLAAPEKSYQLKIVDPMGKTVHELGEIELNAFGAFDGEYTVPESGAVGWYRFELRASFAERQSWQPLRVLISDFTPAPFRVTTDLNGELFRDGERVEVATAAALHSGGPYVEAQTRVTAILRPAPFRPTAPAAKGFWFDTGHAPQETLHQSEGELDGRGLLDKAFDAHSSKIVYGTLTVESAVRDDRGKQVAGRSTARFAARDRFVGIRQDDWVLSAGKSAEVRALVTDELGQLAADVPIRFRVERRKTQASRVKGAGNAYITHYVHSWEAMAECNELSGDEPAPCSFTPDGSGLYRVTAEIEDTQGRALESSITRWSTGPGVVVWEAPPGHSLEVMPEKETLRVGETARYLVKNPFPGARALVTIERYGVLESWTETLDESTSIIEFPVKPDFIPGFYLSVVVMSPRVDKPRGDGVVDLAKPAFRIGYARTPVRDPYKELEVTVEPAAEEYKPRDTVSVEIRAKARDDEIPEMEFAVAVLDESVLDLLAQGTKLFDPYEGFYTLESLDMFNYNLLTRLIGIQKFEKKGANPGGGGGMDPSMRSLFKFVSYWNPSVWPDADGRASIEFELPDNLTGWRVLVMAVTPGDRMGLGQGEFRVNRPTEIRPALPNQVIEGDRFEARFTVMNRTDALRTIDVRGTAAGSVSGEPAMGQSIEAEPYKRYPVSLPVTTTLEPGEVRFEIQAGDEIDADGLVLSVPVNRKQALEAAATYGTTVEDEVHESLLFPDGIRTDVGRVSVVASPTVIGGIDGAFEYLRDYPYICWEQVLTKGVMAGHYQRLRPYLPVEFEWPEAASTLQATLDRAANYQAPNGGMCYYVGNDRYVSPYLSAYTALAFHWLRQQGHEIPSGVEGRLHDYLLELLRKDVFPSFFSKGMASSVRAVALAALAPAGKVTPDDISRYRGHVPEMDLFGKAHYLQALNHVQGTGAIKKEVLDLILSHANESGGKIAFTEQLDNAYVRMLHSDIRTSCAILSGLAGQSQVLLEQSGAKDLPFKMVRSLTQTRKQRDRWENTQENMFCMNALVDYRRRYEAVEPKFSVQAHMNNRLLGATRFKSFRAEAADFERPIGPGDPGRDADVRIRRKGTGRLYYSVRLFYSPVELKQSRINSGIEVRREYSVERDGAWIKLEDPVVVERGELVRSDIYITLPAPRNFVVVDDPVPGGLEPVNRDLATASIVDADKAEIEMPPNAYFFQYDDWYSYAYSRWSFYHKELRNDSARFYSEYLPAGRYHLSYVAQVIAPGEFTTLPVRVEEMYDPDVFGQGRPGKLQVGDEAPE